MEVLGARGLTIETSDDEAENYCLSIVAGDVIHAVDVSWWLVERLVHVEDLESGTNRRRAMPVN
jgi:hypothetical protein